MSLAYSKRSLAAMQHGKLRTKNKSGEALCKKEREHRTSLSFISPHRFFYFVFVFAFFSAASQLLQLPERLKRFQ